MKVSPYLLSLLLCAFAAPAYAQDAGRDAGPESSPDAGPEPEEPEVGAEPEAEPEPDTEPDEPAPDEPASDEPAPDEPEPDTDAEPGSDDLFPEEEDDELFPEDGDLSELLESEDDLAIPPVLVTASRIDEEPPVRTGGGVTTVDEEQLARLAYSNPNAVIQQVGGAYLRNEDGFGLRPNIGLRGVTSERSSRVTLMEDGVLFGPAPYAAPAAYYFPVMTRITGVDVYMGAATLPYGPMTVGGAIDFRGRDIPREPAGGIDLALGTYTTGRLHLHYGASNEWGGIVAEGVYVRSDGFKRIDGEGGNTGFDRGEMLVRGELHGALGPDAYHRLELRFGLSGEGSNETYLGLSDEDFRADPYRRYEASRFDRMQWWRTQVQLRHHLEVGDGFELRTAAYRHDLDRAWNKVNAIGGLPGGRQVRLNLFDILNDPSGQSAITLSQFRGESDSGQGATDNDYTLIGTNYRRFGSTGLQTAGVGNFETGELSHRVLAGARVHHDAVDRIHSEDAYALIGGAPVRATDATYETLNTLAEALAVSLYAAYALTLFDAVTLTPGVRGELVYTSFRNTQSDATTDAFRAAVLPGGTISWDIVEELTVFAGVMRGFAPVAPGQAAGVAPEDAIDYELGVRFEHEESGVFARATGFVNDYQNLLQQCSFAAGCAEGSVDEQSNGGAALVGGFDAQVGANLRFGDVRLPLRATYTFTYGELLTDIDGSSHPWFIGGEAGDRLPYIPEHQVAAQAGFEIPEFGINLSGSYVSSMWEAVGREGDGTPRTDEVFLLDASAYLRIFDQMQIYVRGENLTDTRAIASRRPFGARPVRPLQIQGGFRVRL